MGKKKDLNKRVRRTQKQIKEDNAKAALALKMNTRPIKMLLQKKPKQQPQQQQQAAGSSIATKHEWCTPHGRSSIVDGGPGIDWLMMMITTLTAIKDHGE